jgi:hypothetical protein
MTMAVREYLDKEGSSPFSRWFGELERVLGGQKAEGSQ